MFLAAEWVYQKTNTEGTDDLVLISVPQYRTFAGAMPENAVDNMFYYTIFVPSTLDVESGTGYIDGSGKLVRNPVRSTNGNAKLVLPPGIKKVTCDIVGAYQGAMMYDPSVNG